MDIIRKKTVTDTLLKTYKNIFTDKIENDEFLEFAIENFGELREQDKWCLRGMITNQTFVSIVVPLEHHIK